MILRSERGALSGGIDPDSRKQLNGGTSPLAALCDISEESRKV